MIRKIKSAYWIIKKLKWEGIKVLKYLVKKEYHINTNNSQEIVSLNYFGSEIKFRPYESDIYLIQSILVGRGGIGEYNYRFDFNPDVILDLGANIGLATIIFRRQYPECKIICVEPADSNFVLLKENCKSLSNIEFEKAGVWYHQCYLKIMDVGEGEWAYQCVEVSADEQDVILGLDIDTILEKYHCTGNIVVKMDIEGAEKIIFENGPGSWLDVIRALIIEQHDGFFPDMSPSLTCTIQNEMAMRGFTCFTRGENYYYLK